jgi:hypothetical protein
MRLRHISTAQSANEWVPTPARHGSEAVEKMSVDWSPPWFPKWLKRWRRSSTPRSQPYHKKVVQHISSYETSREPISLLNRERRLALPCPSESYLQVSSGPRLSGAGRHVRRSHGEEASPAGFFGAILTDVPHRKSQWLPPMHLVSSMQSQT